MEYNTFVSELEEKLQEEFHEENVKMEREMFQKVNQAREGLVLRFGNEQVAPILYLEGPYEMHQQGKPVGEIAREIAQDIREMERPSLHQVEPRPELAAERLYTTVMNAEANRELLQSVPHQRVEDLAVVARYRLTEESSILMTDQMCEYLQMTSDEVMETARINTDREGYSIQTLDSMMEEYFGVKQEQDLPMYVLTNERRYDGAAAIASKEALQEAYERMGEGYYVLPSSRHELILLPERMFREPSEIHELESMVQEVNAMVVETADQLSDHVYHYDGETKQLTLCGAEEKEQEKEERLEKEESHSRGR